ncbi:MAG: DNA alkylation repair protein [Bacilli bacterium]|nr:DNA alkylation repair protein [Bacilli bacterium]
MTYQDTLNILFENSDETRAIFNNKIIRSSVRNLGVPSSVTLDIAKRIAKENIDISDYPINEYHEINLIIGISTVLRKDLSKDKKFEFIETFFENTDNWAVVDSTAAKFKIKDFELSKKYLNKFIKSKCTFVRRYVYVCLLDNFTKLECFDFINKMLRNDSEYYVQMAESWLISNLAIKGLKQETIEILNRDDLDKVIINKAISKICDSFRVSEEDKNEYRKYRRK